MKNKKQLKLGELVQIWDTQPSLINSVPFAGHGQVGYLVQNFGETGIKSPDGWTISAGTMWEVICFGEDPPAKYNVHESWLNPIDKFSDIKKLEDE